MSNWQAAIFFQTTGKGFRPCFTKNAILNDHAGVQHNLVGRKGWWTWWSGRSTKLCAFPAFVKEKYEPHLFVPPDRSRDIKHGARAKHSSMENLHDFEKEMDGQCCYRKRYNKTLWWHESSFAHYFHQECLQDAIRKVLLSHPCWKRRHLGL